MKKLLWVMSGIFAILAVVFYSKSIVKTGYGYNTIEVANVQMTVFAAASAILCGVNGVGAMILSAIDTISSTTSVSTKDLADNIVNLIGQSNQRKEEINREQKEEAAKQQARMDAELKRKEEMNALREQGKLTEVDEFLTEIESEESMIRIWEI